MTSMPMSSVSSSICSLKEWPGLLSRSLVIGERFSARCCLLRHSRNPMASPGPTKHAASTATIAVSCSRRCAMRSVRLVVRCLEPEFDLGRRHRELRCVTDVGWHVILASDPEPLFLPVDRQDELSLRDDADVAGLVRMGRNACAGGIGSEQDVAALRTELVGIEGSVELRQVAQLAWEVRHLLSFASSGRARPNVRSPVRYRAESIFSRRSSHWL